MSKDPFAFDDENDRTVLQPQSSSARTDGIALRSQATSRKPTSELPLLGDINPLEKAASRLLPLLITIRNSSSHPDPQQLRNELIRELEAFKQQARQILEDPRKVTQASYVMCTVLDEAVMNTPWGYQANWSQHNLLATFHNEVTGGERFFSLLKDLGRDPEKNIELLELMYVCLSLGFEGAYRITSNGQDTLLKVRRWLYDNIQSVRAHPEKSLSAHWQGSDITERKLSRFTPIWVLGAGSLALASVLLLTLKFQLAERADDVIAEFWDTEVAPLSVRTVVPPVRAILENDGSDIVALTLTELLNSDIERKSLQVLESYDNGKIRIIGSDLFASGRADLNSAYGPLIGRIAEAVDEFDGSVIVTGHSDNVPIRSGRYESNLELSQSRAESVASQLSLLMERGGRVSFEGRGSLEPIADNASPAGRNANRRVEVSVYF